ncbi:hypothetical protein PQE75_gp024 [Bacillus phage vB_BcoS-136]|uniref:Uncharacterized protein n=1 Tax=Bacillus phage vB_BcoS-136 TaxID=2419619 RepID=A0A3G3BVS2_9CAUD|nr:hypothetical protein PQE75_gp024 [Bacillus phage vB_BcoS-136]AYP68156.1 hypothetical protein vBBcoS136_00024 [Bacillus phage vB_BcoS-136]
MKSLEVILEKRQDLNLRLELYQSEINELRSRWKDLDEEERKEYGRLFMTITRLETQIDTLTYVINHDSKMRDAKHHAYKRGE